MDKNNNITSNILKKKIIQRAKNLIIKLSFFNPEENNSSLKNELYIFFREKHNSEEEKHIKETISIIFYEELAKLGIFSDNYKKYNKIEEQKKQSPQKNENFEKIIQETKNIYNYKKYKVKKKVTQNERLEEIIKKIENDGGVKSHLIDKIKQLNTNIFSYFQFDIDKLNELTDISKEKLLTMICLFYPFFSKEQKNNIDNLIYKIFKDNNNINKLYFCLLINNKSNIIPNILNLLIKEIISDKDKALLQQEIENDVINVNLENQELVGHQVYIKNYQFYLLYEIFKNHSYTKIESFANKIIFKLQLILYSIYLQTNCYPFNLIHDCVMNKKFFKKLYNHKKIESLIKIEKNYEGDGNDNFYWENFSLVQPSLSKTKVFKTNELFTDRQRKVYNYCFFQLKHFYSYENKDIIACRNGGNNFNFLLNFYEGVNYINNYKFKIPLNKYKKILVNLEKEIFDLVKDNYISYNNDYNELSSFKTYKKFQETFNQLNDILHKKFKDNTTKFNLYPYGSIAKLNGATTSDLDCFLQIDTDDKDLLISFVEELIVFIKTDIDKNLQDATISTRLLVITFKYNNIIIDLNIVGYTPYLHSVLFRIYNLLDARFSMLVLCIKHIIKEIGLKTYAGETNFLNSFSWELLVKAFLQDIIKPPILPKIIENSDQDIINARFGKMFFNLESGGKSLNNFVNDMYNEKINVPIVDFNKAKEIYNNTIKIKNKMPCSELLLKFLFFVIFIFKGDSIYVNNTKEKEGFENIIGIFKPKTLQDKKFRYYFRTKYKKSEGKKKPKKDGIFLFRDPFDVHYNPGQSLKEINEEIFYNKMKKVYYHLMETGSMKGMN